jgi:hypothetical protein
MAEKIVEMMIDGKKTLVSEKILNSRIMREKKVEVEINGKKFRCPEHMMEDMMRFGASQTKRTIKNPPKEVLLMMEAKKIILPVTEYPADEIVQEVKEIIKEVEPEVLKIDPVIKERKKRVISRSK